MAVSNDSSCDALNFTMNRVVGIKQYQHIKKVMEGLESKPSMEIAKVIKVDQKIR